MVRLASDVIIGAFSPLPKGLFDVKTRISSHKFIPINCSSVRLPPSTRMLEIPLCIKVSSVAVKKVW
jgi:hypothetical protein